jgi:hypothetical protein
MAGESDLARLGEAQAQAALIRRGRLVRRHGW